MHSIFKTGQFNKEELDLVLSQFEKVDFSKNDLLMEEGKVASYYFFLESGFARSFAIDLEGNEVTTNFFAEGDIVIDWKSYFQKSPCREYIKAIGPGIAWRITFEKFMKLFHIEAFRAIGRNRLVTGYFDLKNHSVSMISVQAKERYLELIERYPDLGLNVPLKYIASYLGITDTSLSRIRKELSKEQ